MSLIFVFLLACLLPNTTATCYSSLAMLLHSDIVFCGNHKIITTEGIVLDESIAKECNGAMHMSALTAVERSQPH